MIAGPNRKRAAFCLHARACRSILTICPSRDGAKVAAMLLDDVAQMNADAKFYTFVERHPCIALDHGVLHFERAAHRVDHAAKFDEVSVAGAFDDSAVMRVDGWIDQIAAQPPEP